MAGIDNIDDANEYLVNTFIPNFNKHFALDYKKYPNAFEVSPSKEKINYTLAILSTRKIDNGSSIIFKSKYYQPYNCYSSLQSFLPGTECLVIEAFNGSLWATINDCVYPLMEIKKHKSVSSKLNDDVKQEHHKKIYLPPMTHP